MKARLHTLLSSEKITPSKFADIIGVNRSSISHILSGRNNPSLDILQKVLTKFPHINPDWLMLGQGNMFRNKSVDSGTFSKLNSNTLFEEPVKEIIDEPQAKEIESNPVPAYPTPKIENEAEINESSGIIVKDIPEQKEVKEKAKTLQKIVFFYSDNTFEIYKPE